MDEARLRLLTLSEFPEPSLLERLGLKVSAGHGYRLEDALLPGITSAQARELLRAVSGSLAQMMVDERRQA